MPANFRDKYRDDALSVTQLVRKMKTALQFEIGEVWVEGEVSNLRVQKSGHRYFTIKDAGAQFACVLFKGRSGAAGDVIKDGKMVKLFGEITVYEQMGRAQMIVQKVKVGGEGGLQAQFEELKQRLNKEGLFDSAHKNEVPPYPQKIGLITSPSGAALQDMLNVFSRRAPWVEIFLYGVTVQGKGAEKGIARAIKQFSEAEKHGLPQVDTLIVARGGGSIEDLWNFNEELVARAIYDCSIPVISGVGHEIDFTISDFAADHRAPTPSAAAEIAVPDGEALLNGVRNMGAQLQRSLLTRLEQATQNLQFLSSSLAQKSPVRIHAERVQYLGDLQERIQLAYRNQLNQKATELIELKGRHAAHAPDRLIQNFTERLKVTSHQLHSTTENAYAQRENEVMRLKGMLRTLGPDATLARGYSITMKEDGSIITSAQDVSEGEQIQTQLHGGRVGSVITSND